MIRNASMPATMAGSLVGRVLAHRVGLVMLAVVAACAALPGETLAQTFAWFQRANNNGPSGRSDAAMAYDSARGVTVLFGGWMGSGPSATSSAETWEWNGATWTQRNVAGPSARDAHSMAYDSARGVTVLFGGTGPTNSNQTWEWNGTTWTQRVVSGPSARYYSAMAYDSLRHVTVLFGGFDGGQFVNDTWEWNGTTWTQRFVSGPSPRNGHGMVFDSGRGVCVLFGGYNNGVPNNETWEWNGSLWTLRQTGGPSPRTGIMAYDSARGVTVLYGGIIGGNVNGETWEWNGAGAGSWTQRAVNGPFPRQSHAMVYDAARHATVMFGGNNWFAHFADTWEWANCVGVSIFSQPVPQNTCILGSATFNVTPAGTGPFTYQWQKRNPSQPNTFNDLFNGPTGNGGTYSGVQTSSLTVSAVSVNDLGDYRCVVTNNCGTVTSNAVALTQTPNATIFGQPSSQGVCYGSPVSFSVTVSPPSGSYTYQWQKRNPVFFNVYNDIANGPTGNGGTYSGAQTPTLTISSVFPSDLGEYRCVVNAPCQSIISNDASLLGPPSPFILTGPTVTPGCTGGSGSISITAGPAGSTYQWQRYFGPCSLCYANVTNGPTGNGGTLSGAQSATLTITGLNLVETFAQYRCVVTGPCANTPLAASADAFFELQGLPNAGAPLPSEVCPGGTVSISMNTINVTSFLWEYYNGFSGFVPFNDGPLTDFGAGIFATVSGATTGTLTLSNTTINGPIAIRFSGGNICQIMAPIPTTLSYATPPVINQQPATTNYCHLQPSSFTVGASSALPLTYQWQLYHFGLQAWINLNDGFYTGGVTGLSGSISGSLTPTLTFTLATIGTVAPNQPFRCIVSNGCQQTTTQAANLHICIADFDCNGSINSQDFFGFLTAFFQFAPAADVNTSGQVNSQDYFDFLTAFFAGC